MTNKTFATQSNSCSFTGEHVKRITREEKVSLRQTGSVEPNYVVKMMSGAVRNLSALLSAPLAKKTRNSMCKYYGHIIEGPWQGYLPKCADCGIEISSPDQLRKATPSKK